MRTEILGWPVGIAAGFTAIAVRMVEHRPNLGLPHARAMGDGLFEVRARGSEGIGRAFFCTRIGQRIVILHGFIKKSQATPKGELQMARKPLLEVRNG